MRRRPGRRRNRRCTSWPNEPAGRTGQAHHDVSPPGSPAAYRARIEHTLGDRELWARVLRTVRAEATGVRSSLAELRRECPDLPPVPVHVLTAGTARSVQRVHEAWKATVSRAPNARYTHVPESGHYMPIEAHTVVVTANPGDARVDRARVATMIVLNKMDESRLVSRGYSRAPAPRRADAPVYCRPPRP
jgi:hypothetical protein